MTLRMVSRIGPKGQVVLKKELRDELGLRSGMFVEETLNARGILIRPVEARTVLRGMEEVARRVAAKAPKTRSAVEAVRSERK